MRKLNESDISMFKSLHAYGFGIHNHYYQDIEKECGKHKTLEAFNKVQNAYKVVSNTYTDSEGGSYNTLIPINN